MSINYIKLHNHPQRSMNLPNCPLPVNGDQTSVNDDGELKSASSGLGESNGAGGVLPRAAALADQSSKNSKLSGDRSVIFRRPRWSWLVGNCCWRCEEPVPSGGVPKIRQDQWRKKWVLAATFELKSPAFWSISGNEDHWDTTVVFQASNRYQARPVRWPDLGDPSGSNAQVRVADPGLTQPQKSSQRVRVAQSL